MAEHSNNNRTHTPVGSLRDYVPAGISRQEEQAATKPTMPPWERVQLARHPERPHALDYIQQLFSDFVELHGDRLYGDDAAIIGGIADFDGQTVMLIGEQKGRSTKEHVARNFRMPQPEGYRK